MRARLFLRVFSRTVVAGLMLTGGSSAQESTSSSALRNLELPAHARLMTVIQTPGTILAPFATDGCSGGMSSAWALADRLFPGMTPTSAPPWESCCVTHDHAYHNAGGAATAGDSFDARLAADTGLQRCVQDYGQTHVAEASARYGMSEADVLQAYDILSAAMFQAVRLGGAPCSGLPWRWGYGYPGCGW